MSTRTAPARPQTPAIEAAAADWVTRCDAGLTPAEQQIFQDWLAADARHADAFDRLSEAWAVFDRVQEGGAISEVLAGLARRARQRRTRRVQVAAAAALVVFAALLWVRLAEPTLAPVREDRSRLAANDRIRRLPDGSVVELKPGAEIAVHYEQADARRVTLVRGEAFFSRGQGRDAAIFRGIPGHHGARGGHGLFGAGAGDRRRGGGQGGRRGCRAQHRRRE
jgi:ferric-dicitrate binding protein FerR (iron transport regulator)